MRLMGESHGARFSGVVQCFLKGRDDANSYNFHRTGGRGFFKQLTQLGVDKMERASLRATVVGKREYPVEDMKGSVLWSLLKGALSELAHPFRSWGTAADQIAVYHNATAEGRPAAIVTRPLGIRSTGLLMSSWDYVYETWAERLSRTFRGSGDPFLKTIKAVAQCVNDGQPLQGIVLPKGVKVLTPADGPTFADAAAKFRPSYRGGGE